MNKTLVLLFLISAACFSASLTIDPNHQQLIKNQNNQQTQQWTAATPTSEGRQENDQLSRSPESENEIEGQPQVNENGNNEDKEVPPTHPPQPPQTNQHAQQPQPYSQQSIQEANKGPVQNVPTANVGKVPYAVVIPQGNHPPGIPVTQYSGIHMTEYQNQQTGRPPVFQQQKVLYSGGSNAVPIAIYSDSDRPPITMFFLNPQDKRLEGQVRLEDLALQPNAFSQYGIPLSAISQPSSPIFDSVQVSPLNMWDNRQYPVISSGLSPYYAANTIVMKDNENRKQFKGLNKFQSLKAKEAELIQDLMERSAEQQWQDQLMLSQAGLTTMRSVMNPFWGQAKTSNNMYTDISSLEMVPTEKSETYDLSANEARYNTYSSGGSGVRGYNSGNTGYSSGGSGYTSGGSGYSSGGSQYGSGGLGYSSGGSGSLGYSSGGSGYSSGGSGYSTGGSGYHSGGGSYTSGGSRYKSASENPIFRSRYTSGSGYNSGLSSGGNTLSSSLGSNGGSGYGTYGTNLGSNGQSIQSSAQNGFNQQNQGGHSLSSGGSFNQNKHDHDKVNTQFVQPLPTGGHISTNIQSQKGFDSSVKGQGSYNNAQNNLQGHRGGQSSNYQSGSGFLRAAAPQIFQNKWESRNSNTQQNGSPQHLSNIHSEGGHQYESHDNIRPIITLIPMELTVTSPNQYGESQQFGQKINPQQVHHQQATSPKFAMISNQAAVENLELLPLDKPTTRSSSSNGLYRTPFGTGIYGNNLANQQYSNLHNGQIAGQSSGAANNQQYGHENVNTGFSQPLPGGGQIYTQVNSDKGFSGNNFGQQSQSLGVNDQNYNSGGFSNSQGITPIGGLGTGIGVGTIGTGVGTLGTGLGTTGILNNGYGLNGGLGVVGGGVGLGVGGLPYVGKK